MSSKETIFLDKEEISIVVYMRSPACRNWQTRRTQNPLVVTSCGFESHGRHDTGEWLLQPFSFIYTDFQVSRR